MKTKIIFHILPTQSLAPLMSLPTTADSEVEAQRKARVWDHELPEYGPHRIVKETRLFEDIARA